MPSPTMRNTTAERPLSRVRLRVRATVETAAFGRSQARLSAQYSNRSSASGGAELPNVVQPPVDDLGLCGLKTVARSAQLA